MFEDLRRRYGPEYFAYELANEENFFGLMQLGLADIAFDRVTAGMPSPRTFLDVGCATGMLLQWMQGRRLGGAGRRRLPGVGGVR